MGEKLGRLMTWTCILVLIPIPAGVTELSAGVSVGGLLAGTVPRFAVGPHARISWRTASGFVFAAHDLCSILPPHNKDGVGVYNQTSVDVGYTWDNGQFSAGPSLSIYSMPACGARLCGRVAGVAPGGHAQTDVYFSDPLGVSVSANVDWVGGRSFVLPGGLVAMVVVGPVVRWSFK